MFRCAALMTVLILVPVASGAQEASLSDPTQPHRLGPQGNNPSAPSRSRRLDLQATYLIGQREIAVINGRTLRPGDRIQGYELQAIEQGAVLLYKAGKVRRLLLHGRPMKKSVPDTVAGNK